MIWMATRTNEPLAYTFSLYDFVLSASTIYHPYTFGVVVTSFHILVATSRKDEKVECLLNALAYFCLKRFALSCHSFQAMMPFMVQLSPMLEPEFETYLASAIQDFAQDKVKAGNWHADEGLQKSEQSYRELLLDGVKTNDQHLFSIFHEGQNVGMIWFAIDRREAKPRAFIYDFVIDAAFRRQGLGRQAMLALEEIVKALGLDVISLHVFGHNRAAKKLYEQVGYEVTNIHMSKKLT